MELVHCPYLDAFEHLQLRNGLLELAHAVVNQAIDLGEPLHGLRKGLGRNSVVLGAGRDVRACNWSRLWGPPRQTIRSSTSSLCRPHEDFQISEAPAHPHKGVTTPSRDHPQPTIWQPWFWGTEGVLVHPCIALRQELLGDRVLDVDYLCLWLTASTWRAHGFRCLHDQG